MEKLLRLVVAMGATSYMGLARAADLPVPEQAAPVVIAEPPIPPAVTLHGFTDASIKNDYITPRGLLVTNKGATIQSVDLLILDVYNNPAAFVNDVSFNGGIFLDLNPGFAPPNTNAFNEIDYLGGGSIKFAHDWTFGAQYEQFDSPQNAFFVERNTEVSLQYDDSGWNKILPLNPYAKFFYEFKGKSSVVVTGHTATFDVEVGAIPTYDLTPHNLPVVLTAPTWVTVGPSEFWGGTSNFGVFSTGLVATLPVPGLPSTIGPFSPHAFIHGGVQYYRILNNELLVAQTLVGTAPNLFATHRDVFVPSVGLTVKF